MANLYHDEYGKFSKLNNAKIKNDLKSELANARQDISNYQTRLRKSKNGYGEYTVKSFAPDGKGGFKNKSYEPATYYTEDWDDALNTFNAIVNQYGLSVENRGDRLWIGTKKKN